MRKNELFVIYDGITNSVFQSQVLHPLLAELDENLELEITLISFEERKIKNKNLIKSLPAHDRLHIMLCRKLPFIGKPSLWFAAYQLKRIFKQMNYEQITTRGPLAGYIVLRALRWLNAQDPMPLIIQARGLCAQEYRYTYQHEQPHFWRSWWRYYIYRCLEKIESLVYGGKHKQALIILESVSPMLKDYLAETFRANPNKIVIAVKDIPERCTVQQVQTWRQEARQELGILCNAIVYCYSGSWRPWQCADKTIEYFADIAAQTPQAHLLILTADQEKFVKELKAYKLNAERYTVFSVPPDKLLKYLAAADFGILFREQDIINWVSRPTKMLEYQSVGLKIIHNNTVGVLTYEMEN